MSTCGIKGCHGTPEWAPKLTVPARGWSIELHQPLTCIVGIPLCTVHMDGFDIFDLFHRKQLREMFQSVTTAAGKCPADVDRLQVSRVRLDSFEYLQFESTQGAGRA